MSEAEEAATTAGPGPGLVVVDVKDLSFSFRILMTLVRLFVF